MPRLGPQCTFQIIMVFICKCSLFCISKLLLTASQFLSCKQHDHTEAKKNKTSYQLVVQESRLLGEFWVNPVRSMDALCQTLEPHETTHATLGDGRWTSDLCLSMCSEEFEWTTPINDYLHLIFWLHDGHIFKCRKASHNHIEVHTHIFFNHSKVVINKCIELFLHLWWSSGCHLLKQVVTNLFIPGALPLIWIHIYHCTSLGQVSFHFMFFLYTFIS